MPAKKLPTRLAPCATFDHDGLPCEAFAYPTGGGRWAGHVTVRPAGSQRKVLHRLVVKGEHDTVDDFVSAAVVATRKQLAEHSQDR